LCKNSPVTAKQSIDRVDPFKYPGRYLVTTASGTRYLIDAVNCDRAVEVVRVADVTTGAMKGFSASQMRRDAEWLPVLGIGWYDEATGRSGAGMRVGEDLLLQLNLCGDGTITSRRSTPITAIMEVDAQSDRDAVLQNIVMGTATPTIEPENLELKNAPHGNPKFNAANGEQIVLRHICEVCGLNQILDSEIAYEQGWDYPPRVGAYGIVSPRTCPECGINQTLWWAIATMQVKSEQLNESQRATLQRILDEPESIQP